MATDLEPREVLEARLTAYEAQRSQIEGILVSDPNQDAALSPLLADLSKVIELTRGLIKLHEPKQESITAEESDDNDDEEEELAFNSQAPLGPGDIVTVKSEARTYAGIISELQGDSARLKYFEFEAEVFLPLNQLERLPPGPLKNSDVQVGWSGECKYATDGNYYPCTVEALTQNGVRVKYTQYGNVEEAPVAYLRVIGTASTTTTKGSSSGSNAKIAADASDGASKAQLIAIPEYLTIKETDTEEEKARKMKRIKAIKNKNRLVRREQEQKQNVQSWHSFVNKGVKKNLVGVKTDSIFSTTEELSSTRAVGVVPARGIPSTGSIGTGTGTGTGISSSTSSTFSTFSNSNFNPVNNGGPPAAKRVRALGKPAGWSVADEDD